MVGYEAIAQQRTAEARDGERRGELLAPSGLWIPTAEIKLTEHELPIPGRGGFLGFDAFAAGEFDSFEQ
ncbi:hypothetical protein [Streptomyces sp. NPDC058385]|uniref:hypothetical protein n=1 Tax=Streptomyces sp. NPDC058385 TaxID=3346473 RepID=UPI00366101B3